MKIALKKTKEITRIIRHKWDNRLNEYSLLDQSKPVVPQKSGNKEEAQKFIRDLNEQAELNRRSCPSA